MRARWPIQERIVGSGAVVVGRELAGAAADSAMMEKAAPTGFALAQIPNPDKLEE
jgi:hypothetical protein